MKAKLISMAIRFLMGAIAIGLGIWYLSSSIGGAALTYTSTQNFLTAIGAGDDIASANGCFLCGYISDLFSVIGNAAEIFWTAMLDNIWILLVIGFGIYLFIYTTQYIWDAAKKTTALDTKEKGLEFSAWFDKVWRQAARIMFVGAILGTLGMGGTTALRAISNVTITPVLYVGAELSMAASGVVDATQCGAITNPASGDLLNPILQPFMCTMGNLNAVMLAGAAGGFAMMNYAWLGMGGGAFTWIAGFVLVIMFLIIGFNLFFQVLSIVFKLMFIIIFLPLIIAATAFEGTWKLASNVVANAVTMLVKSSIQIVAISLKILIIYATVSFAADEFFPGPADGYSAIIPPLLGRTVENPDAQTMSVMNVFATCERVALSDGEMDADKFKDCFTAQRAMVERTYPNAFDFLDDGFDFLLIMFFMFVLYFFAISPKVDAILGKGSKEQFDFGTWTKDLGKKIWGMPQQIFDAVSKAAGKKD